MIKKSLAIIIIFFLFINLSMTQEIKIKYCKTCKIYEKRLDAKYCIQCGKKLSKIDVIKVYICPKCNKTLTKGSLFCHTCGTKSKTVYQKIPKQNYFPAITKNKIKKTPALKTKQKKTTLHNDTPKHKNVNIIKTQLKKWGCKLLIKRFVNQELKHTSKVQKTQRLIYISTVDITKIQNYFKNLVQNISIIKYTDNILSTVTTNLKFDIENTKVEIICYQKLDENNSDYSEIQKKIRQKYNILVLFNKQLKNLRKKIKKYANTHDFMLKYKQKQIKYKRKIYIDSKDFWELKSKEKVCQLRQNILLVTIISKKAIN